MGIRNLENFLRDFYKEDKDGRVNSDKNVKTLTIKQLYKLIDMELANRKSPTVLRRLHRRLCSLRATQEREALENCKINWRA